MKLAHILLTGLILAAATQAPPPAAGNRMALGNFSVSLSVTNIGAAKAFYEKLGFVQIGGDPAQHWVIMKSGSTNIGLFQGMFPRNALTFNPGWDQDGSPTGAFEDVRSIQRRLRAAGLDVGAEIASASGPASFSVTDPDGNPILFDQHR
ncbi:MAG TPA: VOC family protein [Allosphingosinicella sp.]|jgi:catechol 2,3-dioxygenase-like lactoylglutathione lyase family enzyme|nr:VOC family protein [Allosphingosinicella sp.]